jgi:hypothetical protein
MQIIPGYNITIPLICVHFSNKNYINKTVTSIILSLKMINTGTILISLDWLLYTSVGNRYVFITKKKKKKQSSSIKQFCISYLCRKLYHGITRKQNS